MALDISALSAVDRAGPAFWKGRQHQQHEGASDIFVCSYKTAKTNETKMEKQRERKLYEHRVRMRGFGRIGSSGYRVRIVCRIASITHHFSTRISCDISKFQDQMLNLCDIIN